MEWTHPVTIKQPLQINATASADAINCSGGTTTITVNATGVVPVIIIIHYLMERIQPARRMIIIGLLQQEIIQYWLKMIIIVHSQHQLFKLQTNRT